jgi:pyruvate/2-oxoglutarate dehydrogenase complex dihydrolipoamide dehydrogenase (E3) component
MSFAMLEEKDKQPTAYKLICVGEEEKVVGLHIIGEGSDEILQGCEWSHSAPGERMLMMLSRSCYQDGRYQGRFRLVCRDP